MVTVDVVTANGVRGSRRSWPPPTVVNAIELTSKPSLGSRWEAGAAPSCSSGRAGGEVSWAGAATAPGVSARYGSAMGSGSALGVANPSGRSTGAYAAPSFQLAMRPIVVGPQPAPVGRFGPGK